MPQANCDGFKCAPIRLLSSKELVRLSQLLVLRLCGHVHAHSLASMKTCSLQISSKLVEAVAVTQRTTPSPFQLLFTLAHDHSTPT